MTALITPSATNSPIYAPSNTEAGDAGDLITTTIQPIANQIEWTKQRIPGVATSMEMPVSIGGAMVRGSAWLKHVDYRPYWQAQATSGTNDMDYALWIPLHDVLPVSCQISGFGCSVQGNPAHVSSLPQNMPEAGIAVVSRWGSGGIDDFERQLDTTSTLASYILKHNIQRSLNVADYISVNTMVNEFWFTLRGEYGTNASDGLRCFSAWIFVVPS